MPLGLSTRYLFFTGKGGVGKTTLACATALALAAAGKRVLIVSTDPASNLDEMLGTPLGPEPRPVTAAPGLSAANIDPEQAAQDYRQRVLAPYEGVVTSTALAQMPAPEWGRKRVPATVAASRASRLPGMRGRRAARDPCCGACHSCGA